MFFQDEKLLTLSVSLSLNYVPALVGAHGTLTFRVGLRAALLLCTGTGQDNYPDNPACRWGTELMALSTLKGAHTGTGEMMRKPH